jgi:hypothetical protein
LSGAERSRKSEENSHLQRDAAAHRELLRCASVTLYRAVSVRERTMSPNTHNPRALANAEKKGTSSALRAQK